MRYRPEIDGLRSIAVVPVVFFHAGFQNFAGGFVGVDVFFVISGFLITRILLEEIEGDRFSILRFYERRVRRLMPALFFVLAATVPFALAWMRPSELADYSVYLGGVVLFIVNIVFWRKADYFAPVEEENPLLHTWSLAVEEQFYLFFPLILLFLCRRGMRRAFVGVAFLCLASLLLSEWGWRRSLVANFFLLPPRAWELGAGALCAFWLHNRRASGNELAAAGGLSLILFSVFTYDKTTPFPSLYAIVPVAGTSLVLLFATGVTWTGRLLALRLPVWIGLLSYSAYLWHQPILAFARLRMIRPPSVPELWGMILLTFLLAWLSWRYVEKPFRQTRNRLLPERPALFSAAVAVSVVFLAISVAGIFTRGFEDSWRGRHPDLARTNDLIMTAANTRGFRLDNGDCRFETQQITPDISGRLAACAARLGPGIAILGDSHARDSFIGTYQAGQEPFLFGMGRDFCRPNTPMPDKNCQYDAFAELLETHPGIFREVVFSQGGSFLLIDNSGRENREIFRAIAEDDPLDPARVRIRHDLIDRDVAYLHRLTPHARVVWLGPKLEPHISERYMLKRSCTHDFVPRPGTREVFERLEDALRKSLEPAGIDYFSQLPEGVFPILTCETAYWRDGDHWSMEGSKYFMERNIANGLFK